MKEASSVLGNRARAEFSRLEEEKTGKISYRFE
jgi:hypothetical protein